MNPTETARRCAEELWQHNIIPIRGQGVGLIQRHLDAYAAELKSKNNKLINVCSLAHNALDNLMGDSDLDNDDSLEMRACQALAEVLNSDRPEPMVAKSIQGLTSIAELQAEIERLKKALESESKGTLIVEVHRLKRALAKAQTREVITEQLHEETAKAIESLTKQLTLSQERERELVAAFHHNHVSDNQSDVCKSCGLDLRDSIHNRADKAKAALQKEL